MCNSQKKTEVLTEIDGLEITGLIRKYKSPLFIFSESEIRKKYRELKNAFQKRYEDCIISWPYKTNYLDAVCKIYHTEGAWAEVVSGFEYEKALNNKVKGENIIFNGPYKLEQDLIKAIQNKSYIHIDNFDEIKLLKKLTTRLKIKAKVAIRVNMDTGIKPPWQRFGFNFENNEAYNAIKMLMNCDYLNLCGLHIHLGMQIVDKTAYSKVIKNFSILADKIKRQWNKKIEYIDLGGGFASKNYFTVNEKLNNYKIPDFNEYAKEISESIKKYFKNNLPLLVLEPGRALIEDAGYLAGTVLAKKELPNNKYALVADTGINLLFMNQWYIHEVFPVQKNTDNTDLTILGPLCMNVDVIRSKINFPLLNPGDNIVIKRVGAYNLTRWMQFITYRPNVVLIDQSKKVHIIRKQETIENFLSMENIPNHLK